jgi:hypothetical protein
MCKSPHCIDKRKKKVESVGLVEQDLFSSRDNIEDAFRFAKDILLESVSNTEAINVYTALGVIENTLVKNYNIIEKEK